MPTLKQVTCSLEFGSGGREGGGEGLILPEYRPRYVDGAVEVHVAVPEVGQLPFHVHLRAEGYLAPGLAAFVYIDGQYQCNRNRPTSTGNGRFDLRLRCKEERNPLGTDFIAREWTFAELQTGSKEAAAGKDFENNLGTVEVVILRCHYFREDTRPAEKIKPVPKTTGQPTKPAVKAERSQTTPAVKVQAPHMKQAKKTKESQTASRAPSTSSRSLMSAIGAHLLDGADDRNDYCNSSFMLDGKGYDMQCNQSQGTFLSPKKLSLRERHRPGSFDEATSDDEGEQQCLQAIDNIFREIEVHSRPFRHQIASLKRALADAERKNAPNLVHGLESRLRRLLDEEDEFLADIKERRSTIYGYMSMLRPDHRIDCRNHMVKMGWVDVKDSVLRELTRSEDHIRGPISQRGDEKRMTSITFPDWVRPHDRDHPRGRDRTQGRDHTPGCRRSLSGDRATRWNDESPLPYDHEPSRSHFTNRESDTRSTKPWPPGDQNQDLSREQSVEETEPWPVATEDDKQHPESSKSSDNQNGGIEPWSQNDNGKSQSSGETAPQEEESFSMDKQQDGNRGESEKDNDVNMWRANVANTASRKDEDKGSMTTAPARVKQYWQTAFQPTTDLYHRSKGANDIAKPDPYAYPSLPTPALPSNAPSDIHHAVRAGRGIDYYHKTGIPTYLDSLQDPYAVFTFHYRSASTLAAKLSDPQIEADTRAFEQRVKRQQMLSLSKEALIDQLLAGSHHGRASTLSAASTKAPSTASNQKEQAWNKTRSTTSKDNHQSWNRAPDAANKNNEQSRSRAPSATNKNNEKSWNRAPTDPPAAPSIRAQDDSKWSKPDWDNSGDAAKSAKAKTSQVGNPKVREDIKW